jgi:mono/diheme cytochrome c family protein
MKHLNITVPLGGIILLLGAAASLTRAEPRRASTDAVSAAADYALARQNPVPAEAAAITKGNDRPTYLRDILPILIGKCVRCHNNEDKIMYNWLDYKTAFGDRWEIRKRVWHSWNGSYYKQPMPAGNGSEAQTMTEEERRTIKAWVETGAVYGVPATDSSIKSKTERIELGRRLFTTVCALCHQRDGQGIAGRFPPLAGSNFLNADKNRAIKVLLHGLQGEVIVNGRKFNDSMPSFPLGDDDIANALTFVYNSFGNSGTEVTPEEVKALRGEKAEEIAGNAQRKSPNAPRELSPWE